MAKCELTGITLPRMDAFNINHDKLNEMKELIEQQKMGLVTVTELTAHLNKHYRTVVKDMYVEDGSIRFDLIQHDMDGDEVVYSTIATV